MKKDTQERSLSRLGWLITVLTLALVFVAVALVYNYRNSPPVYDSISYTITILEGRVVDILRPMQISAGRVDSPMVMSVNIAPENSSQREVVLVQALPMDFLLHKMSLPQKGDLVVLKSFNFLSPERKSERWVWFPESDSEELPPFDLNVH